jgi:hypothetical protein
MTRWLVAACAALVSLPALAVDGLQWQWGEGQTRRYLLRASAELAEYLWVKPELGRDARIDGFAIDLVLACAPDRATGARGWELRCRVEDLSVRLSAPEHEASGLQAFAQELDQTFTGADLRFRLGVDGRVGTLAIEGPDKFDRRIDQFHETFRQMAIRALGGLDLRLPRKGTDRGAGEWSANGFLGMGFPSEFGTIGRAEGSYRVAGQDGDVVQLDVAAAGVMGTGEVVTIGGSERPRNLFEMALVGEASFDVAAGQLVSQRYGTTADATASSNIGEGGVSTYRQRVQARLLGPDQVPSLPESGEAEISGG